MASLHFLIHFFSSSHSSCQIIFCLQNPKSVCLFSACFQICLSCVMPGGSRIKKCPFCQGILFCAQKICSHCKKQQPLKQRLKKKLSTFDEKREEWVMKRKNNHNIASIKDEAIIMLEKLHAIGYKPVLFLGNQTKKKDIKCEILTPRCRLTAYAKEYLQKMGSFYEYLYEGWNQDSTENADGVTINDQEYFTLHLTPCEPPEDANSQKEAIIQAQEVGEARTMELEEASTSQVDDIQTTKAEVDPLSNPEGQVEQVNNKTNKDVNTGSGKRRDFVGSRKKTKMVTEETKCRPKKKRPKTRQS